MIRAASILSALSTLCACAGAAQSTAPQNQAGDWKELSIAWDFGPCPEDGRSCHQRVVIHPDGGVVAAETPNAPGGRAEPTRRFAALDAQEVRELHRIVTSDFVAKLGSFACSPEFDATVRIDVDGRGQEVGGCVHASAESPPRRVVQLLERYRFASQSTPVRPPIVPSGAGDPCTADVGCGKGLVCAVAPCVVAPCTSGTCQRVP
jgi:hypothetical protein